MSGVTELRMVVTVDDFEEAIRFYGETLGLEVGEQWDREDGRGVIFEAGRATLEVFDRTQKESNDVLEAGRVVPGDVRIALRVEDVDGTFHRAVVDGAPMMSHPLDAPWGDRLARLQTPHGLQLTLFSEI
jgi:lactoylglutathione lyase